MTRAELRINENRFWNNLMELGKIGGNDGVSRVSFSQADMEGRYWFKSKMENAGLETHIDGVGNVFGDISLPHSKKLLVGSHLDTVPNGGMFDGALGVIAALECAQTIKENGINIKHGIQIAAFSNEEGTQEGRGLFGSRCFAEGISEDEQKLLEPVLKKAGLSGFEAQTFKKFNPSEYMCYLELHIEQGGVLDNTKQHIGIVEGIVCIHNIDVIFKGISNHAGTTPMVQRNDALLGAAALILETPKIVKDHGSSATVGTCGMIKVEPNARNVIPGVVEVGIEVRDLKPAVADKVLDIIKLKAHKIADSQNLKVDFSSVSRNPSAQMNDGLQITIRDAADSLGLKHRFMPSGASHDAAIFAKYLPTAMIFVPSKNGISHSPDEWTERKDCINGANVLLKTLLRLCNV